MDLLDTLLRHDVLEPAQHHAALALLLEDAAQPGAVLRTVAQNARTDPQLLARLARHDDRGVAARALTNPSTPLPVALAVLQSWAAESDEKRAARRRDALNHAVTEAQDEHGILDVPEELVQGWFAVAGARCDKLASALLDGAGVSRQVHLAVLAAWDRRYQPRHVVGRMGQVHQDTVAQVLPQLRNAGFVTRLADRFGCDEAGWHHVTALAAAALSADPAAGAGLLPQLMQALGHDAPASVRRRVLQLAFEHHLLLEGTLEPEDRFRYPCSRGCMGEGASCPNAWAPLLAQEPDLAVRAIESHAWARTQFSIALSVPPLMALALPDEARATVVGWALEGLADRQETFGVHEEAWQCALALLEPQDFLKESCRTVDALVSAQLPVGRAVATLLLERLSAPGAYATYLRLRQDALRHTTLGAAIDAAVAVATPAPVHA